jgi:hypothetical protein
MATPVHGMIQQSSAPQCSFWLPSHLPVNQAAGMRTRDQLCRRRGRAAPYGIGRELSAGGGRRSEPASPWRRSGVVPDRRALSASPPSAIMPPQAAVVPGSAPAPSACALVPPVAAMTTLPPVHLLYQRSPGHGRLRCEWGRRYRREVSDCGDRGRANGQFHEHLSASFVRNTNSTSDTVH